MANQPALLSSGFSAPESFPSIKLAEIAGEVLKSRAAEALQYGPREGYAPLRGMVAAWLSQEGTAARAEDIVIVTGAKQAIDIVARAFTAPGDTVLLAEPTYMNGLKIFRALGLKIVAVPMDRNGIDTGAVEKILAGASGSRPKLVYDIPDFHNPTGSVLSVERRAKLASLAERYQIPVLEDNPYRWLRYEGTPAAPLKSFDKSGMVIATGTFSKVLSPGLRVAWIHATRRILDKVMVHKADSGTSSFAQMIAHEFFREDGSLARHLLERTTLYRRRRDLMLSALGTELKGHATWETPQGGYYVWLKFADSLDTDALADVAKEEGVIYYRGSVFFARESPPRNYARLAFTFETEDKLQSGVAALARAVRRSIESDALKVKTPLRP